MKQRLPQRRIAQREDKMSLPVVAAKTLLFYFTLLLFVFCALVLATPYHASLISTYTDNETYVSLDRSVTQYVTGLSPSLDMAFTVKETSHLADVRRLLIWTESAALLLLLASLLVLVMERQRLAQYAGPLLVTGVVFAGLAGLVILAFSGAFMLFHEIFFPKGNWSFPATSLLVTVYQETFFMRVFTDTFVIAACLCIAFYVAKKIADAYRQATAKD